MITGRPKAAFVLRLDEQTQLHSLARSRTLPHTLVARARLVLWSAQGQSNMQIARRLHWNKATVGNWRQRFVHHRLPGLHDELRSGRPRSIEDERIARLLQRTLSRKPRRAPTEAFGKPPTPAESPNPPSTACSKPSPYNRIAPAVSNSPRTPSSSRSCATSSACI